ncbi:MAG: hypothetical protein Q9210_000188 [Variospora velana]
MPSGWAEQSSAYSDLHRITYARCNDMADYIGRLRTAQYRLGTTGLELPEFQLVYVLLTGLGVEFDSWASGVRERSSVPSFELLGEELIEKFKNKSKPSSNQKVFLKRSCRDCGLDHPSENCHKFPAPPAIVIAAEQGNSAANYLMISLPVGNGTSVLLVFG